ncbi:hypothetical protein ACFVU3_39365 [Streptomyces sp. NPDC058052]|uniref:hypothetical protein n=1 Tax=Streptomyces sp. NPDC058052 TaxID=3346316 RepID=UPI0036EA086F
MTTTTPTHDDPTWWKAPLAVTLPGLPLLVGEFTFFGGGSHVSDIDVMMAIAAVLLVLCWLPPYRRSFRGWRITAACAALLLILAPWAMALLMGLAMSSG